MNTFTLIAAFLFGLISQQASYWFITLPAVEKVTDVTVYDDPMVGYISVFFSVCISVPVTLLFLLLITAGIQHG